MDYEEYQNLIRQIDGQPPQQLPDGVTTKNLEFTGEKGAQGSATIYFKGGTPLMVAWYDWDLDDHYLLEQLEKELGYTIRLSAISGGNGHFRAALEIVHGNTKTLQEVHREIQRIGLKTPSDSTDTIREDRDSGHSV